MEILLKKLTYNECDLNLILWNNRPCFIVSELSKALDNCSQDDIGIFMRYGGKAEKGVDFDVIEGPDARYLRSCLEESGINKRFAKSMLIYSEGLNKYFAYRRIRQVRDFCNYLTSNNVFTDSSLIGQRSGEQPEYPIENIGFNSYSDFFKHISFMEEFVDAFNRINISADKSVAFTKEITKFLEDKGVQPIEFLEKIKKWIV